MLTDELYVLDLIRRGEFERAQANLMAAGSSDLLEALRSIMAVWDDQVEVACDEVRQEMEQQVEDAQQDSSERESDLDDREADLDDRSDELDARERELEHWERRLKELQHCPRCPGGDCAGVFPEE